jgi:predicted GIY-YIG superfamily endonuclease
MQKMRYIVYIIESQVDASVYIGCTANLEKRLLEHNRGLSNYTKSKMPWQVAWYSVFFDRNTAYEFERYLKTSSGKAFRNKRLFKQDDGRVLRSPKGEEGKVADEVPRSGTEPRWL